MDDVSLVPILYIEDEETLAQLVKRRLMRYGFEVDIAPTAEIGLQKISQTAYSAVIIDYNLPVMTGLDVLRQLHQRQIATPSIMVSGQDDIGVAVKVLSLGCLDYLVKDGGNYLDLLPVHLESAISRRQLEEEKKAAELANLNAQKSLARAQKLAHIGNWDWLAGQSVAVWSEQEYRIFGLVPDDFVQEAGVPYNAYKQCIHPDDRSFVEEMKEQGADGKSLEFEYRIILPNGDIRWLHAKNEAEVSADGQLLHYFGTTQDITERKYAEKQLLIAQQVFESTVEGIMVTDKDETIISVNPAFTSITGYEKDEVVGQTPALFRSGKHDVLFYKNMELALSEHGAWAGEVWNKNKQGQVYPEWVSITVIRDEKGEIDQFVSIFSDISQHKEKEKLTQYQANYDALTGLPNRNLFNDRLARALKVAEREGNNLALLFLDLDRFKWVNDTLGHRAGDQLLKEIAERLKSILRDSDSISRLGGDEFTIVLTDLEQEMDAETIAIKVLETLAEPYKLDEQEVSITVSVGIAVYPADGSTPEMLYRNADNAMYAAKDSGRNQFSFFTTKMQQQAETRLILLNELHRAIEYDQFELYYQPVIHSKNNSLYGAEVLIRWNHPTRGLVFPNEFIPLAEETGLIELIGKWVVKQALLQLSQWNARGHYINIAINKSSKQFNSAECATDLTYLINSLNIDTTQLTIEVTESVLMERKESVLKLLNDYRKAGITISLDDFGTGYSSLNYLRNFPFDVLKIDRSFVMDITSEHKDTSLIETMILMGHKLGLRIVAEGVETLEQQNILKRYDCEYLQGFLYSAALPAAEFEQQFIMNPVWKC